MPNFRKENSKFSNLPKTVKDQTSDDIFSSSYFPPPEDRMSQKEVAYMFEKTPQTIINWSKKGLIVKYQLGRIPFYSRKQLIALAVKDSKLIS